MGHNRKISPEVFIIGLDGATFDLIKPWVKQGKLPNFAKIINDGVCGELTSTIHPLTPQAWTSFMTGKNPGKHGIFDFMARQPGSYGVRYVNSTHCRSRTIWKILSDAGKNCCVFNVPFTYPPEPVKGIMISGMGTPGKNSCFTYPPEIYKEIVKKFGEYELLDYDLLTDTPAGHLAYQHRAVKAACDISKYLLKKEPWDIFMAVFMSTDHLQHYFWHYMDTGHPMYTEEEGRLFGSAILDIYQEIDTGIGELLSLMPDNVPLIIMSDHGAGPTRKMVYLHRWLEKEGLLTMKVDAGSSDGLLTKLFGYIRMQMRMYMPKWLKSEILRLLPDIQNRVDSYLLSSEIDWEHTKAYPFGYFGNININLKGREPSGIAEDGKEYDEICSYIKESLPLLQDNDTGQKVVDKVYRREELYRGKWVKNAPDIIVIYNDGYYSIPDIRLSDKTAILDGSFKHAGRKMKHLSHHRLNGISLFRGDCFRKGEEIHGAHITDIAPTILYLLGLPIPADMDGRVIKEAFQEHFIQSHPVGYDDVDGGKAPGHTDTEDFSEEDKKIIEDSLRGLGYL